MKFLYTVFETDKKKYLYDAVTNHIFSISEALFRYHGHVFKAFSDEKELLSLKDHGDYELILKTYNDVKEMVTKGFMGVSRLKNIDYKFDTDSYVSVLEKSLHRMILEITRRCNLRCKYCSYSGHYYFKRTHENHSMSLDTARKAVDFLYNRTAESPVVRIDFYGGEALLEFKKIIKIVDYAEELFKGQDKIRSYEFTTNGTLLNERVIDWLAELLSRNEKISSRVAVTFNGPPDVHNRYRVYRNGRGSHRRIMDNIVRFKEKYPDIFEKVIVFQSDYVLEEEISDIRDFFDSHPALRGKQVSANLIEINDCDEYIKKLLNPPETSRMKEKTIKELKEVYLKEIEKKGKTFLKFFLGEPLLKIHYRNTGSLKENTVFAGTCRPFLTRFFVKTDGSLHICERMCHTGGFGNIYEGFNINKILDFLSLYKNKLEGHCLSCFAVRFCSFCHEKAVSTGGYDEIKHMRTCNDIKYGLIESLRAYCEMREIDPHIFEHIDKGDYERD